MEHAGVDRSCQQVVRGCDGVQITCQVKVEILHRDYLAVTTPCCAALDPKGGSLAWLADARENPFAQVGAQSLAQTNHGGAFTFSKRGGCNCSHIDILAIRDVFEPVQYLQPHLGFVIPVKNQFFWEKPDLFRNLGNGFDIRFLGDLNIRWHWITEVQFEWCELA